MLAQCDFAHRYNVTYTKHAGPLLGQRTTMFITMLTQRETNVNFMQDNTIPNSLCLVHRDLVFHQFSLLAKQEAHGPDRIPEEKFINIFI